MGKSFVVPVSVEVVDSSVGGRHGSIPIRHYHPRQGRRQGSATLVWLHGGAFAWGGLDQLESHAVAACLAATGRDVVAVDYRRAPTFSWFRGQARRGPGPGYPFPVPGEDVVDALTHVARSTEKLVLGGASAGACLAATAAGQLRGRGVSLNGLLLAYGTFHAELPPISADLRSRTRGRHSFFQFNPRMVQRMNLNYAGNHAEHEHGDIFPGGSDLHGLPPTTLIDADRDTLRASGGRFAEELRAAGVAVDHRVIRNATHGFLDRPQSLAFSHGLLAITDALANFDESSDAHTENS